MDSAPTVPTIADKKVIIRGLQLDLEYPVADARLIDGLVVVLYDPMSGPNFRQFRNVEAFGTSGERIWTAEHPTSATADSYVRIESLDPLRLCSFAGYLCELDPESERLVHAEFTK